MHYSDRTHISHEILAVFSFLVCHVMKDPNLLKGEVRSVDSHHALTSLRLPRCVSTGPVVVRLAGMANERERERERLLPGLSFHSQVLIPAFRKARNPWASFFPSERALCFAESELLDTLRAFDVAHSCGRYVW